MKVTKKDIYLLISMVGILIAVCSWQFGYVRIMDRVKEMEEKNQTLEAEIDRLEALERNRRTYLQKTEEMASEINRIMSFFPSNVLPEDDIKLAYEMDAKGSGSYLFVNSFTVASPALTYTTNETAGEAGEPLQESSQEIPKVYDPLLAKNDLYPAYSLYTVDVNMGLECNYEGLRNMIQKIYASAMRKSINSVSLAYDESTGHMNGSAGMHSYFVTGMDRPYTPPSLTPVRQGTGDPFGTIAGYIMDMPEEGGDPAAEQ